VLQEKDIDLATQDEFQAQTLDRHILLERVFFLVIFSFIFLLEDSSSK